MANPLSIRAQRFTKTLTRLYGLRIEKGFMYLVIIGHCKDEEKIPLQQDFLYKKEGVSK